MKLLKKLRDTLFATSDDSYVAGRRRFLRGAAGLAAVAVVGVVGGGPSLVRAITAAEKLGIAEACMSGVIWGQTFISDHPLVLMGLHNVEFRGCTFIATKSCIGAYMLDFRDCSNIAVTGCTFIQRSIAVTQDVRDYTAVHASITQQ